MKTIKLTRMEAAIFMILKHKPEINTGYKINNFLKTNFPLIKTTHQQVYRTLSRLHLLCTKQINIGKPDSCHYKLSQDVCYQVITGEVDPEIVIYFGETELVKNELAFVTDKITELEKSYSADILKTSLRFKRLLSDRIVIGSVLNGMATKR